MVIVLLRNHAVLHETMFKTGLKSNPQFYLALSAHAVLIALFFLLPEAFVSFSASFHEQTAIEENCEK